MPHLPARFAGIVLSVAPLFVHRSWRHAQALLIGAILCSTRLPVLPWVVWRATGTRVGCSAATALSKARKSSPHSGRSNASEATT
ncbi:hypothetical protein FV222_03975 [Methylobacterium sp. WL103]|nr:hypothetical protein FV222_03975 [Methylobacterium sp. WL103]